MNATKIKFRLGRVVATPGALAALEESNQTAIPFLIQHQTGNWGEVCKEDAKSNDEAIAFEGDADKQQRVLSCYKTSKGERLWLITEWDRSITTILLPSELYWFSVNWTKAFYE
jgi:hypothetical protein